MQAPTEFRPLIRTILSRGWFGGGKEKVLSVRVFAVIDIEKDRCCRILKIEKRVIPARHANREHVRETAKFLAMQSRVSSIYLKAIKLYRTWPLDIFREIAIGVQKIIGANDRHERGGCCLIAFRYERLIRSACAYSPTSSEGMSSETVERIMRSSSRIVLSETGYEAGDLDILFILSGRAINVK